MTDTLWFAESHMFLLNCSPYSASQQCRLCVRSLSLCMGAKLGPSGCQMCHYFAGPLRRDVGYLLDSAPQHHIAHRTRRRGRKLELVSSWPMPGGGALWASSRGVAPQTLGVGKGIQKEIQKRTASFLDVMPSSHTPLDHGGKQATKKRISKRRFLLAPYVRCQILVDSCSVAGFFVVPAVVVTKLWQQRCFWCVVRTQIDLGSWNWNILENLASLYGTWVEIFPLSHSQF